MTRPISSGERFLLQRLGALGEIRSIGLILEERSLCVESMNDGGMGSFLIGLPKKYEGVNQGNAVVTATSNDIDGVLLVATLYINDRGFPYEVDIWKVDFSPIVEIPDAWELENFPRFPGAGVGRK